MHEKITVLAQVLKEEEFFLIQLGDFLKSLPNQLSDPQLWSNEFGSALERYELHCHRYTLLKRECLQEIADSYSMPVKELTWSRFALLGFNEIAASAQKLSRLSVELAQLLLRLSIYLKHFSQLHSAFALLNRFFQGNQYSALGDSKKSMQARFSLEV